MLLEPLNDRDVPGYFLAHQLDALALVQGDRQNQRGVQLDLYHAQIMDGDLTRLIGKLGQAIGRPDRLGAGSPRAGRGGEIAYPTCSRCWRRQATTTG